MRRHITRARVAAVGVAIAAVGTGAALLGPSSAAADGPRLFRLSATSVTTGAPVVASSITACPAGPPGSPPSGDVVIRPVDQHFGSQSARSVPTARDLSWSATLTAPLVPGTYPVDAVCGYNGPAIAVYESLTITVVAPAGQPIRAVAGRPSFTG